MSAGIVNSNDAHFDARLHLVDSVINEVFGSAQRKVQPVAYEENFPFPYNNFVYAVHVERDDSNDSIQQKEQQPGTEPIAAGLSTFILRLPNAAAPYHKSNRVENEVAALSLAREALARTSPNLVPRVFAWSTALNDQGWVLMEHLPGKPLLKDFEDMTYENKRMILEQMADILGCLEVYQLPSTIKGYGGLTFSPAGEIVSGPLSIFEGGPFPTYEAFIKEMLRYKLAKSDFDPRVKGWRDNNVRARLDDFMERGVHLIVEGMEGLKKVLVHADLSPDNLLYDPATMRLTGLFDFDFAHIATVADEFFRSLDHRIGRFPDAREDNTELYALRNAMLHGFPELLPTANEDVDWPAAKIWDDILRAKNISRPSTIANIAALSDVFFLSSSILPFKLCNEVVVRNSSEERLAGWRASAEAGLIKFLDEHDF